MHERSQDKLPSDSWPHLTSKVIWLTTCFPLPPFDWGEVFPPLLFWCPPRSLPPPSIFR